MKKTTTVFYEIVRATDGDFCVTLDGLPSGIQAETGRVQFSGSDALLVYPGEILRLVNFPSTLRERVRQRGDLLLATPHGVDGFSAMVLPFTTHLEIV